MRAALLHLLLAVSALTALFAIVPGGVAYASGEGGGSIAGKVTDSTTKGPVAGATVCAAATTGLGCATTNSSGEYTITGLASGEYTVLFTSSANYLSQYYDGKASASEATPVQVTSPGATTGIDAALRSGGQITGKVTSATTKAAVAGATVCASNSAALRCATTGLGGEYTIDGLPTGEYTVLFTTSANYLSQYYNGKTSASEANPVSVTAGATRTGINAALRTGGQISGTVTDASSGAGLSNATVCATGSAGTRCASTNSNGKYTIKGLATGEYTVVFSSSANYIAQYYNGKANASEATPVTVTAGATALGISAALQRGGEITGTVTDASTAGALAGTLVCATGSAGLGCATTNSSGEYTITGLATGQYTVKFSAATYVAQFYNGKANASEATPVSVTAGATTAGIGAAMQPGAQITGTVTDAATKGPLAGTLVCATTSGGGGGCASTNSSGEYTITGLASGEYTVKFSAATYVAQFYNGKVNASEATPLQITAGTTTAGINAAMQLGGQITGTVTDAATKAPVPNTLVCASGAGGAGSCAVTGEAGEYTINGLATGEYTVKFTAATYVTQFYKDKANASEATPVSVTAGATTSGIAAALHVGGQITGTVTDAVTKAAVPDALVCASGAGGSGPCAVANEAGEYKITGLATGEYTVKFTAATYVTQFYKNKANASEATPVSVTAGATTSGIAAALRPSGQITGKVTAAGAGTPLAGATVCASVRTGETCAVTNEAGEYAITGLENGEYTVEFSATGYAPQFYDDGVKASEATPVSIKGGATASGIGAALKPAGQVAGEVTDGATKKAIVGAQVCAVGTEQCTLTGEGGKYTLGGLAAGEYKIRFTAEGYASQYYDGKADDSEATPVTVAAGQTTSGIGAALRPGGAIAGKVTDAATKKAVAGATVCASGSGVGEGCEVTNQAGEYTINGLEPGKYAVDFSAPGYVAQYYNGKASASEATPVSVTAGATTPSISALLAPEPKFEVELEQRLSGELAWTELSLTGKAPLKVEYRVLVTNTGTVPVKVESIADTQVPGCSTSPKTAEVPPSESAVEATCSRTLSGEGETLVNVATVRAAGRELQTEEVEASTESKAHFQAETLERRAGEPAFGRGPLRGAAPLTVEYEVLVSNQGAIPLSVEHVTDRAAPGCEGTPLQPVVKVGESRVVEARCTVTIGGPGETRHNAAIVTAGGVEVGSGEVEAGTEAASGGPPPHEEPGGSSPPGRSSGGGSSSPGGGVLGTQTATLTRAQIEAALRRELAPPAKARKIAALLKAGGLVLAVNALEAGTLQVTWYELPPGAKLAAKKAAPKPVAVATGRIVVAASGSAKIKIKLSSAGRALLAHAKRLSLTAKGIFTPAGLGAVSATAAFQLKR